MMKFYAPALALALLGNSASAQQQTTRVASKLLRESKTASALDLIGPRPTRPTAAAGSDRAAFYSEDFSSGAIPSGWTNTDDLTPLTDDPVLFEWSDDPAAVEVASGSFPEIGVFNATGAANGYLWANSDNFLTAAPATEHLTRLTTSAIDCSGQPTVMLSMLSTIGVFNNDANEFVKVRVSTDQVDWTDFFPFPCLVAGDPTPPCSRFSANPQEVAVNITSIAANQATVYLQFEWQGNWEYYWAIDDVELSPLPDNEIVMNFGFVSTTGNGEEYGRVPQSQLPATLNIGAEVTNFGAADQTNVTVQHRMEDEDGNAVLDVTTDLGTLASQDTVVTDEDPTLPALASGVYTTSFTMTSDQIALDENPDNNSKLRTFAVTPDTYSLDAIGLHPAGSETLEQVGTASFADNAENVKLMNYYQVFAGYEVTGVEIGLGPASVAGGQISISILDTTDVLATPANVNSELIGSEIHVLTQGDIDAGVVGIPFSTPFTLDAGGYYVVANITGSGTLDIDTDAEVFILDDTTIPQPGLASVLYIPFDPPLNQNLYGGNGTAWAIRLSSSSTISVPERLELDGVTMYPNPTNGSLTITTNSAGKFTLEVLNVLGDQVMTDVFTGSTTLDLADFANGVYTVRIANDTHSTVQRVTVN